MYFCLIDYTKAFECVDRKKLWKILKEMEIPDCLTCLLRKLNVSQEAKVRTKHGKMDSVQFSSVTESCPTACDPMNRSMPGLSVHHHLPEFTQTHVHRISDAIKPSNPLLSPSPSASNPS